MDPPVKVKLFTSSLALPIQEGSGNQTMHTALQARDSLLHAHSKTLGLLQIVSVAISVTDIQGVLPKSFLRVH